MFAPAERIFVLARENPDGKGHVFDGLADLTDQLPISRAREDEVAAAMMARAVPALLASLLLVASTGSAGPETQVLDRTLEDGRRVRLRYNPSERLATVAVTMPQGALVDLTLERAQDGTFSVIDAAVREDGGVRAAVQGPELAGLVDALVPAFAEQASCIGARPRVAMPRRRACGWLYPGVRRNDMRLAKKSKHELDRPKHR